MFKLTTDMKAFILNNQHKSTYTLVQELEANFDVKVSYNSVRLWKIRQQKIVDEYLSQTGKDDLNLEEMFALIMKDNKSALRKYWESTIASAIVDYYKKKKLE